MSNLRIYFWGACTVMVCILVACQINAVTCDAECEAGWMDSGGLFRDPCANDSDTTCLVSKRIKKPEPKDLARPVIIAVHGFGASTYEWKEFRQFADSIASIASAASNPMVSLVLLGGHGRDIDSFRTTTWEDWGRPIFSEYDSLVAKGYKNISIAGASTGGALLLQGIASGAFAKKLAPNWIYLIDPIIIPSAKLLSLANLVGPLLGNSPNPGTSIENQHWYVNRPEENLTQLYELTNRVKNQLEVGFKLPKGTRAKVYKATHDRSADPVGALLIYKGMRNYGGGRIHVEMIDTRLHVFTRLLERGNRPSSDYDLQRRVFNQMIDSAKTVTVK